MTPKPPPTSGAMQRTRVLGRPSASAIELRFQCGAWVEVQTVRPRVSGSGAAATAPIAWNAAGPVAVGGRGGAAAQHQGPAEEEAAVERRTPVMFWAW